MATLTWIGIGLCLLHSAIFSGLNLAMFGVSRLELEIEADKGERRAERVLALRRDANFLLTTILWGNVGVNVLLTLLSESVLAGVGAFAFSTLGITFLGEILPQAYFSRNALKMGALLAPVLRFYQWLLFPVAKPSALILDWWLGPDGIAWMREQDLRAVIHKHMHADEAEEISHSEAAGALNFLAFDDLPVSKLGEPVDPRSVIALDSRVDLPVIPPFDRSPKDAFVQAVAASGRKWVILTDHAEQPLLVLDADAFLRSLLPEGPATDPYELCHRPMLVTNMATPIGSLLRRLHVQPEHKDDDVIDRDLILVWGDERRVITGADLLGRLLRGIATKDVPVP